MGLEIENNNILIIGKNSYIGKSFIQFASLYNKNLNIVELDVENEKYENYDFSKFDVIYHVAGIVHIKENDDNRNLYYKINRDLVKNIAEKAKKEGVKQYIFLSTMSVYGKTSGIISSDTELNPKNAYGDSKLQAEKILQSLENENFNVSIVRPPMVYGNGCKGNYNQLSDFAKKTPFFPDTRNKRSMIYIDNLNWFINNLIENKKSGIYMPQNSELVNTFNLVNIIGQTIKKNILRLPFPIKFINILNLGVLNKVFGDLYYSDGIVSNINFIDFKESIIRTEGVKVE